MAGGMFAGRKIALKDKAATGERDLTLHQRIREDIETQILSGAWAPGHRIPFEVDLAAQYGCSRMTVNKVLTQLAGAGLIERKKRSGTFVLQPRSQSAVIEIHDIETEVRSLKKPYSFQVLRRTLRKARATDKRLIETPHPTLRVLDISCLHLAGPKPFCLEERLINLASVPEAASADFEDQAPGRWLINRIPWSSAEHTIQALGAPSDVAALLQIPEGTACLVVERRTWSDAGPVTHVRFTYPGSSHALVATFTPTG